jgi:LmbE family N-acetylglucosaminyl deacetylase
MIDISQEIALTPQHPSPPPNATRVLVIAPHPDDEILGCGGTLYQLARQGAFIKVVIATNGALGGTKYDGNLVKQREQESILAAQTIGVPEPTFWGLPDRSLRFNETLIDRITECLLAHQADAVFSPALTENHPDHQAVALATQEACRRLIYKNSLSPTIFFYEVSNPLAPNMLIDISNVAEVKLQAVRCFVSQLKMQPYDEQIIGLNRFRSFTLGNRSQYAEAFLCIEARHINRIPLFQSNLSKRLIDTSALSSQELPHVNVYSEVDSRDLSASTVESLISQTYPNLELADGQPPLMAKPTAGRADQLFLLIKKSEIINSDQVEKMVDVFRTRGLHSWGGNHAVRLQGGALEMIRADQLPRREQLRYVAISKSSDTGRWAHRLLSGLRRALGFS